MANNKIGLPIILIGGIILILAAGNTNLFATFNQPDIPKKEISLEEANLDKVIGAIVTYKPVSCSGETALVSLDIGGKNFNLETISCEQASFQESIRELEFDGSLITSRSVSISNAKIIDFSLLERVECVEDRHCAKNPKGNILLQQGVCNLETNTCMYEVKRDVVADNITDGLICPLDVFECPDGGFVPRKAPDCSFDACPIEDDKKGSSLGWIIGGIILAGLIFFAVRKK